MRRIGIVSFPSPGHYYPLTALGRRLQSRGHEVVYFQVGDVEAPIRAAGLTFHQIGQQDYPPGRVKELNDELGKLDGLDGLRFAMSLLVRTAKMIFRDLPGAIREAEVDSLIVDQVEMSGGTVAEYLGLPFVSAAAALPINLDSTVPFVSFPWAHSYSPLARLRNLMGNAFFKRMGRVHLEAINRQRRAWGLRTAPGMNELFSELGQFAQLPAGLELSGRRVPPNFHYTGPWTDPEARAAIDFPWSRIDPARLLIYASMGTLQNGVLRPYRIIAEACAGLDLQLVISLGGGQDPSALEDLPGDPIVVGYAPQLELIRRSAMTISHGGLNTVLESLERGIPMVVLPVTNDQPGVGTRVEWSGVGRSIPVGRLTAPRLRSAVCEVLGTPAFRERAEGLRTRIEAADGLNRAAAMIETAFGSRPRQPASSLRQRAGLTRS
ncbi:nucleotide disphospho-sugar-binding domain-containing protein [Singulisphaera sp. PoT]|uniref:nucleotide disphospho-sugar-binding domain-containing protein n=1 Tax=Singulisphaera sp. PoT TaxID=3411797 RepID=UPI003BF4BB32